MPPGPDDGRRSDGREADRGSSALAALYRLQEPLERAGVRALIALSDPTPADAVLDVATGTGMVLKELSHRPVAPRRVVGVDRSPELLTGGRSLPKSFCLRVGDALDLPFADASFDVVLASYLLHVLDARARRRAVDEMARVLRPGGRLGVLTVWHPRPGVRRLLNALPRTTWLRAVDPAADLRAAGLRVERRALVRHGWPSLAILARRPVSRGA